MVVSDYIPCFKSDDIEKAFGCNRVVTQTAPGVIYVAAGTVFIEFHLAPALRRERGVNIECVSNTSF